ncbi:unnamed protein product [Acanthoscelides obtectus]|uniref:Uncharacterized protein n=1 Tax=Acanthoscelides obtectus TaxID=200917 RepID=A0A9P0PB01_ACAOB|nr:unnamed protein product [Acanthoscelides obtectus]CAK1647382.1 hypothetical protein AOBTE_LOCUS15205 [Acanthoscelides obtectus]
MDQKENRTPNISSIKQTFSYLPGFEDISENDISNWLDMDKHDVGYDILPDDELINHVLKPLEANDHEDCEDDLPDNPEGSISHGEAEDMVTQIIQWYENQEEA